MPIAPADIALRAAVPGDRDFVAAVYDATIRPYAEQTFGVWDRNTAARRFDPATYWIVRARGVDAGCQQIVDEGTHLQLNVLYILPRFQNAGIGSVLLERMIAAADKPIRLRVLRVNPARRLYERHGFTVYDEATGTVLHGAPSVIDET